MIKSTPVQAARVFVLLLGMAALQSPLRCWDLQTDNPSDSCGAGPPLVASGRLLLSEPVGDNASPHCSATGCIFEDHSDLRGPFPTSVGDTYTVAAWVMLRGYYEGIFAISVSNASLSAGCAPLSGQIPGRAPTGGGK